MAILYELLAGPATARGRCAADGARPDARVADRGAGVSAPRRSPSSTGAAPAGVAAPLVIRGAHALDPRPGSTRACDLLVRDGRIAELADSGEAAAPDGAEVVDAEGLHAFPAFVDPHVHLRTPGREDEEDIETGTRAAAAGGFCAIIAMANTDPVVDAPPMSLALRERAQPRPRSRPGFIATVTRGMAGEELTEMAELRDAGAVGFTDDGLPIASARVLRRALQYQRLAGGMIAAARGGPRALGDGVMHEGEVSARSAWPASPRSRSRR